MGNHTEALQIDFAPNEISFQQIVQKFWQSHNPIGRARTAQYKSAIWYASEQQQAIIAETAAPLAAKLQSELTTEVLPMKVFYVAEDYHQKYILQRNAAVMKNFMGMYPRFKDVVDSTAAARLNGFAGGYGTRELFDAEKHSYGQPLIQIESIFRP